MGSFKLVLTRKIMYKNIPEGSTVVTGFQPIKILSVVIITKLDTRNTFRLTHCVAAYRTGIAAANKDSNIRKRNKKFVLADLANPFLSGSKLNSKLYFFT